MFEFLRNWFVEEDPEEQDEEYENYFRSEHAYSSEIYAMTQDGGKAQVAYIPLALTEEDHEEIDNLRNKENEAQSEYFKKYDKPHWWSVLRQMVDINNKEWEEIHHKYDTIVVYKKRRSKELHDAHLHLVLSSPYIYEVLDKYRRTGVIEMEEVKKALEIADGLTTPSITCLPKWKVRAKELYKEL